MRFRDISSGIGKHLLKLKAGEEVRGAFRGDPVDFRQHWSNNRGVMCTGPATCELCKAGEKSAFRFRINFIVNENGAYVAKIFEQGRAVYEALKALHLDYDLTKNTMKIRRHGSGTETTYAIVPLPNGLIGDEMEKKFKAIQLHQLAATQNEPVENEEDL